MLERPDGDPDLDVEESGVRTRAWHVPGGELELDTPLLIADGHHRYETARIHAAETGARDPHVLMALVSLRDPGLTIFPTHRLLTALDGDRRAALQAAIERDWEVEEVSAEALEPPPGDGVRIGFLDAEEQRPLRLTLRDPAVAARALPDRSDPYRRLDTAVLEALLLDGALGMTEDDISHLRGLDYARSTAEARERVLRGDVPAGFFMGATPVELVREVAAAGEVMPPKSTYFFPKVLTGLVFNPLD